MRYEVLATDIAWPSTHTEESLLAEIGAHFRLAPEGCEDQLADLTARVDAILTCWRPVTRKVLRRASRCQVVSRYGVGLDNIDVSTATELGIVVTNVPDYCVDEVADHTIALLLALVRGVVPLASEIRAGGWPQPSAGQRVRLAGRTLGLIGFGAIARAVAARAQSLGLNVLAYTRPGSRAAAPGVQVGHSLPELLAAADIISVHVPLTHETRGLIGAEQLARMRSGAYLLNTARGEIVDTAALVAALESGRLAGAGLDVIAPDPLPRDHPLRQRDDVILTPHVAFSSDGSITELARRAAENVTAVLSGVVPTHVVNPEVLDSAALRMTLRPERRIR